MSGMQFVPFVDESRRTDRPGIVTGLGDDAEFWRVVADAAREGEWWGRRSVCDDEWFVWVRSHVLAPQWRWWHWEDDGEDGDCGPVLNAADEDDVGAFRGAEVILIGGSDEP